MEPYGVNIRPLRLTGPQFDRRAKIFRKTRHLNGLARLLNTTPQTLFVLSKIRNYHAFRVPKRNGKLRLIENPNDDLKKLQSRLAFYLQAVYHAQRPQCAYGFIRSTVEEADLDGARNIYSNALRHIESKWVLNLDLSDFFHSIDYRRIRQLFGATPFRFVREAADCLTGLTTYRGRLPMGAPTSPVLSNLVCVEMDHALIALARRHGWVYTRYADDMTFSSNQKFRKKALREIRATIQEHRFVINERKWKLRKRGRGKPAEVTGLILKGRKPDLQPGYLRETRREIELYHYLSSEEMRRRKVIDEAGLKRLRQSIIGRINFVGFVRGDHHKSFHRLRSAMKLSNRLRLD